MALFLGCGVSPEDLFEFNGVVTSAGQALTGQRVEVKRDAAIPLDVNARWWTALPCSGEKTLATTTTDGTGQFNVELFRAQIEPPSDVVLTSGSYCLRFITEAEGTSSWVDVRPGSQQNELGTLQIWRPDARLEGASPDGGFLLSFDAPPPVVESVDSKVRVSLVSAEGVWWDSVIDLADAGVTRVTTELAPEWLEDRQVSVRLEAATMGWEVSPQQLFMPSSDSARFGQLASTGFMLAGSASPPSRGASCAAIGSPCPLTDGSPAPVAMDGGTVIELELGSPMVVRRVGVRGRRYVPIHVGGTGVYPLPTYSYDALTLTQLETGETRLLSAIDADGGLPEQGPSLFGASLFLELDGYFVLDVREPLLPGQRFRLSFTQPLDSLAEVSLLDH